MKKIPMLERFAAQSLVDCEGELIFSKEKFAELIVLECANIGERYADGNYEVRHQILEHFGVEE
jgi:hypothetical protein